MFSISKGLLRSQTTRRLLSHRHSPSVFVKTTNFREDDVEIVDKNHARLEKKHRFGRRIVLAGSLVSITGSVFVRPVLETPTLLQDLASSWMFGLGSIFMYSYVLERKRFEALEKTRDASIVVLKDANTDEMARVRALERYAASFDSFLSAFSIPEECFKYSSSS